VEDLFNTISTPLPQRRAVFLGPRFFFPNARFRPRNGKPSPPPDVSGHLGTRDYTLRRSDSPSFGHPCCTTFFFPLFLGIEECLSAVCFFSLCNTEVTKKLCFPCSAQFYLIGSPLFFLPLQACSVKTREFDRFFFRLLSCGMLCSLFFMVRRWPLHEIVLASRFRN